MRYLGLDYGKKRTGVAISAGSIAVVKEVIESDTDKGIFDRLHTIVAAEDVDAIVVGLPTNMQGEPTEMTEHVQRFVNALSIALEIPVFTTDERLTSSMAKNMTREHKGAQTDQIAAQILLQDYLDKQNV